MKSLSLSRPLVIMVVGLPGSGKSFFARQFAEMFSAPLVSIDFVRHAVAPESAYDPSEDAVVGQIAQHEVDELLKTGKTFMIDGGVNSRTARAAIEQAAHKKGYGKLCIWVQTDEQASLTRSLKRSARRSQDDLNSSMDRNAFERYKRQFNAPIMNESVVVISGKHTFTTQARVVLKKLVSPRDTETAEQSARNQLESRHDVRPGRRSVTINEG